MSENSMTFPGPIYVSGDFRTPNYYIWGINLTKETLTELLDAAEQAGTPRLLAAVASIRGVTK